MPKEKPFKMDIKAFYKSQAEDIAMFAWVSGIQNHLPAVQSQTAIESFKKAFNLSEDDYPTQCAIVTLTNMRNKFLWRKE